MLYVALKLIRDIYTILRQPIFIIFSPYSSYSAHIHHTQPIFSHSLVKMFAVSSGCCSRRKGLGAKSDINFTGILRRFLMGNSFASELQREAICRGYSSSSASIEVRSHTTMTTKRFFCSSLCSQYNSKKKKKNIYIKNIGI